MTALAYLAGVLLFTVGVVVSIGLHEFGHLIPGKLFNVKVTEYFVGFGRTLWSFRKGETEYGVKAIPLGGYCKLVGMVPPAPDQDPRQVQDRKTGMFSQLVDDVREHEYALVEAGDQDRLFYTKPWWVRVIIMGSGVAINLVLAFVLFAIAFVGFGVYQPTTTVQEVNDCVIAVTKATVDDPPRECRAGDPDSPAEMAGFRAGDRIVELNGSPVDDWEEIRDAIRANGDQQADVVVVRDGKRLTLHPTPVVTPRPTGDSDEQLRKVGFLGLLPTTERQHQDLGYVATTMADGTWETLKTIAHLPQKVYHVGLAAIGQEKRDPNSPMSVVGAGRVAGEMAASDQGSAWEKFFSVVTLLAGLNLFLGLINLVPLPPFDGGGIATTLYEAARRGIARLRRRPDPGAVDSARLLPLTYVMAALILLLSVVLIFADIVAPVRIT